MSRALVTGAASGIGRAVATLLAESGHGLTLLDVDEQGLQQVAAEMRARGVDCTPHAVDVRDRDACVRAADDAASHGDLRLLAHCAGVVGGDGALADVAPDAWERIIAVNLTGTFNALAATLPHLLAGGGGSIVVVASIAALQGRRRIAAYSASKAGMVGLVRSVAADYAVQGVRVNAVCPGPTETPLVAHLSRRAPSNAHGRMATAEEVARAAAWLLSEESRWVNAVVLPVDDAESGVYAGAFYRKPSG